LESGDVLVRLWGAACLEAWGASADLNDLLLRLAQDASEHIDVRKAAIVEKDQQKVWDKVAETTSKNNATTGTGTLTALKNSGSFTTNLKKYTDFFKPLFAGEPDVIGLVVVSGDAILGCDMFATHEMFMAHYPDLINAYATQAITTGKAVSVPYGNVQRYLDTLITDERKQESEVKKKGALLKEGNKKLHFSTF